MTVLLRSSSSLTWTYDAQRDAPLALSPRPAPHLEFWIIVAGCAAATWWQAPRALGGNGLSWFYTFEWPILAGIAVAAWWHLIHEDPEERAARQRERAEADPAERTGRVVGGRMPARVLGPTGTDPGVESG